MSDLDRMRKLAGILTESVMAVPSLGNSESGMQTAGNVGRGDADAEFDAAQPGIDEMFDNMEETAPPGMEDVVMDLKREYPGEPEKAFATAWSIYNKKQGQSEGVGMEEEAPSGVDDAVVQQAVSRVKEMMDSFVSPMKATDTLIDELTSQGYDDNTITQIVDAVEQAISSDDSEQEGGICSACNGSGEGQYDGTRCRTCGGSGEEQGTRDTDDFDEPEPVDYDPADDIYEEATEVEESFDLNNGYDDIEFMNPGDFFPDGADSPVTSHAGPSGARMGDNPEQKKMEVAEAHKELVYNYRKFLKESAKK
jgi:hypothetical protein